jgi:hypothetical protein
LTTLGFGILTAPNNYHKKNFDLIRRRKGFVKELTFFFLSAPLGRRQGTPAKQGYPNGALTAFGAEKLTAPTALILQSLRRRMTTCFALIPQNGAKFLGSFFEKNLPQRL